MLTTPKGREREMGWGICCSLKQAEPCFWAGSRNAPIHSYSKEYDRRTMGWNGTAAICPFLLQKWSISFYKTGIFLFPKERDIYFP
jgi:hypothetical protein